MLKNMREVGTLEDHPEVRKLILLTLRLSDRIVIKHFDHRVRYFHSHTPLFDTRNGLLLLERGYSPVLYVPKTDTFQHLLRPSTTTSHCPFKGDASYWSVNLLNGARTDMAWEYTLLRPGVELIRGHVAFANDHGGGRYLIDII